MKLFIYLLLISSNLQAMATDFEILSQDFLYAVRVGDDYKELETQLANVSISTLNNSLNTENKKNAFWLNIYNAFIQIKAKEKPEWISEKRNQFFSEDWICIANTDISFDLIEHDILRKSNWKYGKGYIQKWFPSKYIKTFRLKTVDYRIHFALNCGAKGCPPIAYYNSEKLEEQMETATGSFLSMNTVYNETENTVEVSKILDWFSGDFGGKKGVISILKNHEIISEKVEPKIIFTEYDWTLSLSNYVE